MRAVVIAGGRGTRMGRLTDGVPKPMLKVGGRPVLERQIECFKENGIMDVLILAGYLGHVIKGYFGDGSRFGVNMEYEIEETPLGTSGCCAAVMDRLKDDCMIVYGDLLLDMALKDLFKFHRSSSSAATIVVHPNDHPHDSDLVDVSPDGRVIGFIPMKEKPRNPANLANAAIYALSPAAFKYIPSGRPSDFVKDVFPAMVKNGERVSAYRTAEYIKDMGTPQRYRQAESDFLSGKTRIFSKRTARPAVFMDRDGTLIEQIDQLSRANEVKAFPFASRAVRKLNRAGILAILATNQPAVARNLCAIEEVREMHNRLETLLGRARAYLDAIYFCPHHPDKGYPGENAEYKVVCGCRKPGTGMVDKAALDFNIDIKNSWFIGDTTTDVMTGLNAGTRTVLVRTGKGGSDGKFRCRPDFVCRDVEEAADLIVGHNAGPLTERGAAKGPEAIGERG